MEEPFVLSEQTRLKGLAYRITGSVCDAEDVIQDAWIRWQARDGSNVQDPSRYLTRIVTNLSLDKLRARKKERDAYTGMWLPEPVLEYSEPAENADPASEQELADELGVAFLLALESLSPLERVVFILHDVFAYSFAEVASIIEREPASCRQLASRARKAIKAARPRYPATTESAKAVALAFQHAVRNGDIDALTRLLGENVNFVSDGGGKVAAVSKPVSGAVTVTKLLLGFQKSYRDSNKIQVDFSWVNQLPGFIFRQGPVVIQTVALEISDKNLIDGIYVVRNPEKLGHLDLARSSTTHPNTGK